MKHRDAYPDPAHVGDMASCWLRVFTLGRFAIEWVDHVSGQVTPLPPERLHGQNAANALGLLKALLCCPERFATRDWLLEQFWPNSRQKSAEERLTDVVSSLRGLLRPDGSSAMFVHFVHGTNGRGAGFRLDDYPQLWCDADAFEWYVKHALLLDQRGQDSTVCWERAYHLAERGMYLPEQVYEEWATPKREYLMGVQRDCVQRWIALLRQMGHLDEAILRLRAYWLEHLTDEDALRPLLELLGERERFGEAETSYQKARAVLREDGQTLDTRTTETIEMVRALQIRRKPGSEIAATHLKLPASFSPPQTQRIIPAAPEIHEISVKRVSRDAEKDEGNTKRRELFHLLNSAGIALALSFPSVQWDRIEGALSQSSRLDETVLQDLATVNRSLWSLFLAAPTKSFVLDSALGHVKTLVQFLRDSHSQASHQQLYALASEMSQLVGEIFFDLHDHEAAQSCYTFAALAAKEASAYDLWSCALVRHAFLPLYTKHYSDALRLLQEASRLSSRGDAALPTSCWVAAVEAEAQSGLANLSSCQEALDRAQDVQGRKDLSLPWVRFNSRRLPALQGACYVRLQQPELALSPLQDALYSFMKPDRKRGMVLTDLAASAVQCGEVEQARVYIDEIVAILTLASSTFLWEELRTLPQRLLLTARATCVKEIDDYIGQRLQLSL